MKHLLCLLTLCVCLCPPGHAAAPLQQEPTPAQQPRDNATQAPAPIERPRPIILKPRVVPGAAGATGSTGTSGQTTASRPRLAMHTGGATGLTGSMGTPAHVARPKPPATGASGSTGAFRPHPVPTPPAVPTRIQPPGTAAVAFNRTTIVLDPAHGGVDGGSRITDTLQEKDVDLAFAFKLRSLLTARGFTVLLTRETDAASPSDSPTPLTLDERAGMANHVHPVACLLLHSTGSGKGVHLYSSELAPLPLQPPVVPWLTAQAPWVNASRALQRELGTALTRAELPLVMSRASIRPLDSLTCPALVLELAPNGSDKDSVNDGSYQQRIASAIASAMVFWQNQAQPPDRQLPTPPASSTSPSSTPSTTGGSQP